MILRLADDRVVAPTPAALRRAARVILARGAARGLLAFRVVDTHVHAALVGSRREAGRFAQAVGSALKQALGLGVPFERARIRPIHGQAHLANVVRYVLRQEQHHEVRLDPFHEGSSLPEMLGMRLVDTDLAVRLRQRLPRLGPSDWLAEVGWTDAMRVIPSLHHLPEAAAATVARPHLRARDRGSVAARRAAVHTAIRAGLTVDSVAALLDLTPRAVRKVLRRPPSAEVMRALTQQLEVRTWCAGRLQSGSAARGG